MFRILFSLFTLFIPVSAFAQGTYNLIAPIGSLSGAVSLKDYLEGAFQTLIGIAGILAVLMLVICGIKLMGTGSVAAKSEAKQCIWNAIFGLLLAIGAWILLNTINPILLRNDAELAAQAPTSGTAPAAVGNDPMPTTPGWYFRYKDTSTNIKNSSRFDTAASCIAVKNSQESQSPGSVQKNTQGLECFEILKPTAVPTGSETAARNSICGNDSCVSNSSTNIKINNSPCVNGQTEGCTNVAGIPNSVITMLQNLQSACGCEVTITGGTEGGHKSHGPGLPMVDVRHTTQVDNIIKADASSKRASFSKGPGYAAYSEWLWNGWWFTDEGHHWHACPVGAGPTYCRAK